jgi:hypothetical protein
MSSYILMLLESFTVFLSFSKWPAFFQSTYDPVVVDLRSAWSVLAAARVETSTLNSTQIKQDHCTAAKGFANHLTAVKSWPQHFEVKAAAIPAGGCDGKRFENVLVICRELEQASTSPKFLPPRIFRSGFRGVPSTQKHRAEKKPA